MNQGRNDSKSKNNFTYGCHQVEATLVETPRADADAAVVADLCEEVNDGLSHVVFDQATGSYSFETRDELSYPPGNYTVDLRRISDTKIIIAQARILIRIFPT